MVHTCSIRLSCMLFFQAEDGIRDLVRSRGLGDVYKRQEETLDVKPKGEELCIGIPKETSFNENRIALTPDAVSYTHLTLPTSDLV